MSGFTAEISAPRYEEWRVGDVGWRAESSFGHTEIDSKRVSPRSAFCRVVNLHKREELMSSRGDRNWLSDRKPRKTNKTHYLYFDKINKN